MDNDLVSKRRAERCTTHSHACDCREYEHAQEIERLRAEAEGLREQHGRDSAELRRLCAARDEQRDGRLSALERAVAAERERDALRARIDGAPVAKVRGKVGELATTAVSPDLVGKRVALVVIDD